MKSTILECLKNVGIDVEYEHKLEDLNLNDYLNDSIQFASFIIEIEDALGIEMPYEYLASDKLESLNGFCELIKTLQN